MDGGSWTGTPKKSRTAGAGNPAGIGTPAPIAGEHGWSRNAFANDSPEPRTAGATNWGSAVREFVAPRGTGMPVNTLFVQLVPHPK